MKVYLIFAVLLFCASSFVLASGSSKKYAPDESLQPAGIQQDSARRKMIGKIESEEITPGLPKKILPNWDSIESVIVAKYGDVGKEAVWQTRFVHSYNNKHYQDLMKVLLPYYKQYGHRASWLSPHIINTISWQLFLQLTDKKQLLTVSQLTSDAIRKERTGFILDTHANLLYRAGETKAALKWESEAVRLSPENPDILSNYQKMKLGQKTWDDSL